MIAQPGQRGREAIPLGLRAPDPGSRAHATLSGLAASLRDLDRYLWLAGQYRDWLRKGEDARTNSELRLLFEDPSPEDKANLDLLA